MNEESTIPKRGRSGHCTTIAWGIYPYALLLMALFLAGLTTLIVARASFDRAMHGHDSREANEMARLAIGQFLVKKIEALEVAFYQLAPLSGLYEQAGLKLQIANYIAAIRHGVDVIENGGTVTTKAFLNTATQDVVTTQWVYGPDTEETYILIALELRPQLMVIETRVDHLAQLLDRRMQYRSSKDTSAFFDVIRSVKKELIRGIPAFLRMRESANALAHDASTALNGIREESAQQKKQHQVMEWTLIVASMLVVLMLGIPLLLKIKQIVSKELETLDFMHSVLESLSHPLCVIDTATRKIVMSNSAARREAVSAESTSCSDFFFGVEASMCPGICPLEQLLKTGKPLFVEQEYEQDGEWRTAEIHACPVFDSSGAVVQMIEYRLDITDRKRAAQREEELNSVLSRSHRMDALGLMAGGVAHDLNNILTGVVSYPDLLLLEVPKESTLREPLEIIRDSGRRAAAVVADLLSVAKGVAKEKHVKCLNNIVKDHLASPEHQERLAARPAIQVRLDLTAETADILCSPIHIQKAVMNLINNAFEAIGGDGYVDVMTRHTALTQPYAGWSDFEPGDYLILSIGDTGKGISDEDLSHIFEPFYTKKLRGTSGTGLGLAVVWNTVREHRGFVTVSSCEKGTQFDVLLPASGETAEKDNQGESSGIQKGNGERILVVDDEELQRHLASSILRKLNYDPHVANGGREAGKMLRTETFSLVILDMMMQPGWGGLETWTSILEINPTQRCIICSGFSATDDVRTMQTMGAGEFLRKPYGIRDLAQAVHHELSRDASS